MVYELPEDGTDVPKHVGVVKGHLFGMLVTRT